MNNLNSVLIEGNMVREPQFQTGAKVTPICNFSIESVRFYRHEDNMVRDTDYFSIEARGKLAETCSKYGRKGRGVRIVGRLKQDRLNGNDENNQSIFFIIAEHIEFRPQQEKENLLDFEG